MSDVWLTLPWPISRSKVDLRVDQTSVEETLRNRSQTNNVAYGTTKKNNVAYGKKTQSINEEADQRNLLVHLKNVIHFSNYLLNL